MWERSQPSGSPPPKTTRVSSALLEIFCPINNHHRTNWLETSGPEKVPRFLGEPRMFVQTPEVKGRSGGSGAALDPIRAISLCHPQTDGQIVTGDFPTDAFSQKLSQ